MIVFNMELCNVEKTITTAAEGLRSICDMMIVDRFSFTQIYAKLVEEMRNRLPAIPEDMYYRYKEAMLLRNIYHELLDKYVRYYQRDHNSHLYRISSKTKQVIVLCDEIVKDPLDLNLDDKCVPFIWVDRTQNDQYFGNHMIQKGNLSFFSVMDNSDASYCVSKNGPYIRYGFSDTTDLCSAVADAIQRYGTNRLYATLQTAEIGGRASLAPEEINVVIELNRVLMKTLFKSASDAKITEIEIGDTKYEADSIRYTEKKKPLDLLPESDMSVLRYRSKSKQMNCDNIVAEFKRMVDSISDKDEEYSISVEQATAFLNDSAETIREEIEIFINDKWPLISFNGALSTITVAVNSETASHPYFFDWDLMCENDYEAAIQIGIRTSRQKHDYDYETKDSADHIVECLYFVKYDRLNREYQLIPRFKEVPQVDLPDLSRSYKIKDEK